MSSPPWEPGGSIILFKRPFPMGKSNVGGDI